MFRILKLNDTWFNVDNDTDAENLLEKGAEEFTVDQIAGAEGNESEICNSTMHQDPNGEWYYYKASVVVTVEKRIKEIQDAVQKLLNSKAQEKLYDDAFAICSYANSTDEIFHSEANQFIAWRDHCWRKCYEILALFQSGEIEMPSVEYVMERLPVLNWE